jgi:hypothetical protein
LTINNISMTGPIANSNGSGSGSNHGHNGSQKSHFLQSDPQFKRPDHQIYISNLPQKAGVSTYQIRKLVLKELVDNALDEMDAVGRPGEVTITQDEFADNVYTVTDQGRGIPGTPKEIAQVFSCDKPMTSGEQLRKPTRGCVGNGLRVIVGSVASGGGRIIVKTYDREIILRPRLNGTTEVEQYRKIDWPVGTSVTIEIDPKYPLRADSMDSAELAITLAKNSEPPFARQPSVHWYDQRHLAFSPRHLRRPYCEPLLRTTQRCGCTVRHADSFWDPSVLLSSSGFTTRALKDLIDYIGTTAGDEPVRIFLIIDADASGSMIYQTLVQETKARGARNIEIICLGLFPWEVITPSEMFPNGLAVETGLKAIRQAKSKKKDKEGKDKEVRHEPVADYIKDRDLENYEYGNPEDEEMLDGASSWEEWLQDNRVELNAMTPAKRIECLRGKSADIAIMVERILRKCR